MELKDISNRDDVVRLVDGFYEKVRADALLAPVFSHLDWEMHMPTMYNFWSSMLLGDMSYQGSPFARHTQLNIDRTHFERWLALFHQTVDELFAGATAQEAKDRARSIAGIFQHKLGLLRDIG